MAATSAYGLLDHVQRQLEGIYDLTASARAADFLVDRALVERAGGEVSAAEEVFVSQTDHEEDGIGLGLYLAPALFERLRGKDPSGPSGLRLVTDELSAFVTVAEGVSHVVYLLRCAEAGRQVSLLELELQAEIDKFAVAALHLWGRGLRAHVEPLWHRLFVRVGLREGLSLDQEERYTAAGQLGGRYARYLLERYIQAGELAGFLRDLRQTYRLLAEDKIRALASV